MSEQDIREALGTRKRNVTLTFNLNDQNEREVYEWCSDHDDKCSTFIKKVLSQYKEYREFVQTVSKLHEMMPMMQQMFSTEGLNQNPITNPLQQMSSQIKPFSQTNSNVTPKAPPIPSSEPMPSRSVRHGGSKRRRTSMPME